jgi:hypothetical protein
MFGGCSTSTLGPERDNSLFWFSVQFSAVSTCFHSLYLPCRCEISEFVWSEIIFKLQLIPELQTQFPKNWCFPPWRSVKEWWYSSSIIDLGTGWMMSSQLYAPAAELPVPFDRRLAGPQSWSRRCGEEKISCLCRESNPGRPARSLTLYRLSCPGLSDGLSIHSNTQVTKYWNSASN